MPEILKVTLLVSDIKDTTTTVRSEIEAKEKDHEQVRTITASNPIYGSILKLVLTGKPAFLEGFTLDEIELKISTNQTQLQTEEDEDE